MLRRSLFFYEAMEQFFVGWGQPNNGPSGCADLPRTIISINRLITRKSRFRIQDWMLDNGGFSRLASGRDHLSVANYARQILKWRNNGQLIAAVSQDYLCQPLILNQTGLSINRHQELTVQRYKDLMGELEQFEVGKPPYVMPVLQGIQPQDYSDHLNQYGEMLAPGQWVGVGSLQGQPVDLVERILLEIKVQRPDLKLHGFGIKKRQLKSSLVWDLLHSADSSAGSLRARMGQDPERNKPTIALAYANQIRRPGQLTIFLG